MSRATVIDALVGLMGALVACHGCIRAAMGSRERALMGLESLPVSARVANPIVTIVLE